MYEIKGLKEPAIRLDLLRGLSTPLQIHLAFLASRAFRYMYLAIKEWNTGAWCG